MTVDMVWKVQKFVTVLESQISSTCAGLYLQWGMGITTNIAGGSRNFQHIVGADTPQIYQVVNIICVNHGQNGHHFGRQQFQMHFFFDENDGILIQISLKFVPRSPADNKPALAQVMAWPRRGDKPLPEPVLT